MGLKDYERDEERRDYLNEAGVARRTDSLYNVVQGEHLAMETTYTQLRANLAAFLDQVVDGREVIIVRRRNARDVALIPAEELAGLMETAHLLRSRRNAQRLLSALRRAVRGRGKPELVDQLRREMGLAARR